MPRGHLEDRLYFLHAGCTSGLVELATYCLPLSADLSLITHHGPFGVALVMDAVAVIKHPDRSNSGKAHSLRVPSTVEGS